jgi:hypothetical protein
MTAPTSLITENAKAILLLCGRFGAGDDTGAQPLNIKEYDELATWLLSKKWWPADLLSEQNQGALSDPFAPVEPARMNALLARGASLAIFIEERTIRTNKKLARRKHDEELKLS